MDIICHEDAKTKPYWIDPRFGTKPYRSCSHCGSIHPYDLIAALRNGAILIGADWRYSWPHKFYVELVKSDFFDTNFKNGGTKITELENLGFKPPILTNSIEFFNLHLVELDTRVFEVLSDLIEYSAGIKFFKSINGNIQYSAPYFGYQKGG